MRIPGIFLADFAVVAIVAIVAILGLTAVSTPSLAQDAPQPVPIQGVVLDKASHSPLAGATVRASMINSPSVNPTLPNVTTDGGGRFELTIPSGKAFNLLVSAAGYQGSQQRQPAAGQNSVFIEVALDRLAELRGRFVDDETRMPIAGLHVALVRPGLRSGDGLNLLGEPDGLTIEDDGSFVFKNLSKLDYYLRIESTPTVMLQEIPAKDLAPDTRDKALEVPESIEGYGIVMWPSQAPPLHLASDLVDVGEIRLKRYKLNNLSGVLGSCDEGAGLQVVLLGKNGQNPLRLADLDTACGNGFRILNLSEGAYTLLAQGGPPRRFVSQAFDTLTRGPLLLNVSNAVSAQIFLEVEGVPRENFPADLKVNIGFTPENAPVKIDAPDKIAPDQYEAHLFGNERYRMSVTPPPAYYLKQLSYNGVPSPDLTGFTATPGVISTLRFLFSNHPGTVEVQAPASTSIYLLRDGTQFDDISIADKRMFQQVGVEGKVRFAGLSPGRYRAFLVEGPLPFSQAGLDADLLHSTEIAVEEGQAAGVSLGLP
jgi:Carboxypeptidase regulatory-like domain